MKEALIEDIEEIKEKLLDALDRVKEAKIVIPKWKQEMLEEAKEFELPEPEVPKVTKVSKSLFKKIKIVKKAK